MGNIFSTEMSYEEAQGTLFSEAAGKSAEEKEHIKSEYKSILPIIVKRELSNNDNRLTSHKLS